MPRRVARSAESRPTSLQPHAENALHRAPTMAAARRRKSSRSPSASATSPSRSPSRRRVARVVVAPLGQSIMWQMVEHDPTPKGLQALYVVLTVSGLLAMSRLPTLLSGAIPSLGGCGLPSSAAEYTCSAGWEGKTYDSVLGVSDATFAEPRAAILLLQSATGLTAEELQLAATGTAIAFALLAAVDLLSSIFPRTIAWPKSWNVDNCQCYTEMFAEPARESLVRRPGNVYSNCLYWFGGSAVLMSCLKEPKEEPNVFWLADSSKCRDCPANTAVHSATVACTADYASHSAPATCASSVWNHVNGTCSSVGSLALKQRPDRTVH